MKRPILHRYKKPCIVTLSGPEGCGKSTNQAFIVEYARSLGLNAVAMRGDHLTCGHALRRIVRNLRPNSCRKREFRVDTTPPKSKTVHGLRPQPIKRSMKSRLQAYRRGLCYLLDACVFRLFVSRRNLRDLDLIVFDRAGYDNLAKIVELLPTMTRVIHRLALKPDIAVLVTGIPADLVNRRPGSSLEYYEVALRRFQTLQRGCPELIAIPPSELLSTQSMIAEQLDPILEPETH